MKNINWLIVILGVFGLISVRILEDTLFYDPFLRYFRQSSQRLPFPDYALGNLILHHLFRFSLNLIFSLLIIHFIFKRKDWTIQAGIMIILVFVVAFPLYLYCLHTEFKIGYLFSFYTRRFVIQPLIVLLIIPMYYYRKHIEQTSSSN